MAEMIGGELRFVTTGVTRQRVRHDGSIVDEQMQGLAAFEEAVGEVVDRPGVHQVELFHRKAGNAFHGRLGLSEIAGGNDNPGA